MRRAVAAGVVALAALGGCAGDDTDAPPSTGRTAADPPPAAQDGPAASTPGAKRDATPQRPARCPASAPPGCRTATGRVLYVERVDPDGDGDAHFVLASSDSITAPGISVIDVRADLRPDPLPGPGDRISAAGPVYPGSYGQRQIEAVVVRVLR